MAGRRRLSSDFLEDDGMDESMDVSMINSPVTKAAAKRRSLSAAAAHVEKGGDSRKDIAELGDLYTQCIELATANKITTKNTWELELIDYIDDVIQDANGDDNMMNFQKASCTLEASVKIYSCRVDSVHNETYKMLGGLNRNDNKKNGGEGDDDDEDDGSGEGGTGGKRHKRNGSMSRRGLSTLETKAGALNMKKVDLDLAVDPLFQKTSAAFDEGGAKGLLMNRLGVSWGCNIVFDSTEPAYGWQRESWSSLNEKEEEVDPSTGKKTKVAAKAEKEQQEEAALLGMNVDMTDLFKLLKASAGPTPVSSLHLCEAMGEFRDLKKAVLRELDPTLVAQMREDKKDTRNGGKKENGVKISNGGEDGMYSSMLVDLPQSNGPCDGNATDVDFDVDGGDHGGDWNDHDDSFGVHGDMSMGLDSHELEKAILAEEKLLSIIGDNKDHDGDLPNAATADHAVGGSMQARAADARRQQQQQQQQQPQSVLGDFAFLDAKAAGSWSGAAHWRFRNSAAATYGKQSALEKAVKKDGRKKKKEFVVDFLSKEGVPDRTLFKKGTPSSNSLSQASLAKAAADVTKFVLPEDLQYKVQRLQSLFTKKTVLRLHNPNGNGTDKAARKKDGGSKDKADLALAAQALVEGREAAEGYGSADGQGASSELVSLVQSGLQFVEEGTYQKVGDGAGHMNMSFDTDNHYDGLGDDGNDVSFDVDDAEGGVHPVHGGQRGPQAESVADDVGAFKLSLVEEARKAEKVEINYARYAKKVDVRVLKSTIWEEVEAAAPEARKVTDKAARALQREIETSAEDESAETVSAVFNDQGEGPLAIQGTQLSFASTISSLHDKLSTEAMKNVSIPYCFICLLHLANEKDLQFVAKPKKEGEEDEINQGAVDREYNLTDFNIVKKVA